MDAGDTIEQRGFDAFIADIEFRLISYLRYSLAAGADAEDLFQEVCLRLHRHWESVSRAQSPRAWVFRVAHNLAVNRLKRRATERKALAHLKRYTPPEHETIAAVESAVQELPPDPRQAVCLKIWGGCSWVEIARAMEISEDKAARLFAHGLRELAPKLKDFA